MRRPLLPNAQLVFDGLWQCFCPAVGRAALHRTLQSRSLVQCSAGTSSVLAAKRRPGARFVSSEAKRVTRESFFPADDYIPDSKVSAHSKVPTPSNSPTRSKGPTRSRRNLKPIPDREDLKVRDLLLDRVPSDSEMHRFSIEELEEAIQIARKSPWGKHRLSNTFDRFRRIILFVNHLFRYRDYQPTTFIFESLAEAMAHPEGSADALARLTTDMMSQGFPPTAEYCHAALAVLMNHPDYMLRETFLQTMKDHWFEMGTVAKQRYLVGLLRDEQYELAYSRLMDMRDDGSVDLEPWLFAIFVFVYGKMGFLDEMLEILRMKKSYFEDEHSEAHLLYYVLDVCSSSNHGIGTTYAWNELVHELDSLNPSTGMLENVLNTASGSGDYGLAETALSYLQQQGKVQAHHYETLFESYLAAQQISKALIALVGMQTVGVQVTERTILPLSRALENSEGLLDQVVESPTVRHADTGSLSYTFVSMLVEMGAKTYGSTRVLSIFRDIPRLCRCEPSAQLVAKMIIHSQEASLTEELVGKYATLGPDESSHSSGSDISMADSERLVQAFCHFGHFEPALRFAKIAAGKSASPGDQSPAPGWLELFVKLAVDVQDSRVWEVLSMFEEAGQHGAVDAMNGLLQEAKAAHAADGAVAASDPRGLVEEGAARGNVYSPTVRTA